MNEPLQREIFAIVSSDHVVLFMKGTRERPTCGFSAQAVQILDKMLTDYHTVNVLERPELRAGIKEFSNWPTIPQLYVDGQLIGGCDAVAELHATGRLHQLLGIDPNAPSPDDRNTDYFASACRCSAGKSQKEAQGSYMTNQK